MYLDMHKNFIKFQGHQSKVKVTEPEVCILFYCRIWPDSRPKALHNLRSGSWL